MTKVYDDIDLWMCEISKLNPLTRKNTRRVEYLNTIVSFDIETSSFTSNDVKCAIMYEFMIDVNHIVYKGRNWDDFTLALCVLKKVFKLSTNRRIIIWVHNLSYEFQFMSNRLDWDDVFALEERKVCYCVSEGFEFRCTYLLTGYSLGNLTEIEKLPIKKLTGNLDYKLIRTPITPITEKEDEYLLHDVEILIYLIEKKVKEEEWINEIPITKTSYVRRLTKSRCNSWKYRNTMKNLTLRANEYEYNKKAFSGGFTHANLMNRDIIHSDVASLDLTSDYPAQMVAEMYPMSKSFEKDNPTLDEVEDMIKYYCCIIDIEYSKIYTNYSGDNIISRSKCKVRGEHLLDNGRIIHADNIRTIITEQDYMSIKDFYKYEEIKVHKIIAYKKGYLPRDFILTILDLYKKKTELKGIEERYEEYMQSKENLNSMYGMSVTDIVRNKIGFDSEWYSIETDLDFEISKYNSKWGRFLFYPWGVWVTAYARRIIHKSIKSVGDDYIYSDTDSMKILNYTNHENYFNKFNIDMQNKLLQTAYKLEIDENMLSPCNIKGDKKWLGVWEHEGIYDKFKTLGAKRYMTLQDGVISMTISGLNKNIAMEYLLKSFNIKYDKIVKGQSTKFKLSNQLDYEKVFDYFEDGMYIPKGFTGKNTHTYIDEGRKGVVKDYLGNYYNFYEKSGVHLEETDYRLSTTDDLVRIALGIKETSK